MRRSVSRHHDVKNNSRHPAGGPIPPATMMTPGSAWMLATDHSWHRIHRYQKFAESNRRSQQHFASHPSVSVSRGTDFGSVFRRSPKMARLEAVLFLAEGALSARKLTQLATLAEVSEVRELVAALNRAYDQAGTAFRIEEVAKGFRLLTRPEYTFWLDKLHRRQAAVKLSPPAMETLAIVAYRQPITRADIEAIRGVQCSDMLKQLMDRGLVRIAGEDDSLGRPFLYETTRQFLELFGLGHLDDLPHASRLRPAKTHTTTSEISEKLDSEEATRVDRGGIEPPTPGFSVLCSTN